ncbi:MAG: hypothetical protein ACTSRJ_04250 [Candidatus Hodarchaeales archaeon]
MKYLFKIFEISDEDGYTVHYWITDVIFRFIGEYANFLDLTLNPSDFCNKNEKPIGNLGATIFQENVGS